MQQEIISCYRKLFLVRQNHSGNKCLAVTYFLWLLNISCAWLSMKSQNATKHVNFHQHFVPDSKISWERRSHAPRENPTLVCVNNILVQTLRCKIKEILWKGINLGRYLCIKLCNVLMKKLDISKSTSWMWHDNTIKIWGK